MSTEKKDAVNPAVEPPATTYREAAQAFLEELRRMREKIPHFVVPTERVGRKTVAAAASLPVEFIELAGVVRTNNEALTRGKALDVAESHDLMEYAEAFEPFADELEALAQFVRFSARAAKSKAGYEALTTYALARRLARRPEHADLIPHVADLRRALGRVSRAISTRRKNQREAAPASPADPSEEK